MFVMLPSVASMKWDSGSVLRSPVLGRTLVVVAAYVMGRACPCLLSDGLKGKDRLFNVLKNVIYNEPCLRSC